MKCIIALCLLLLGLHNLDPKLCIGKEDCFNWLEEPLLSFLLSFQFQLLQNIYKHQYDMSSNASSSL